MVELNLDPAGTDLCEAYLRQNLATDTLPMDLAEYTAYYAADYWRPFSTNCAISSFETLTCLSDPLFVNNAAVQARFNGVLNIGLIAPAARIWQGAYSNFVTFKKQVP